MNDDQPPSRSQRGFLQQLSQFFNKQSSKEDLREYLQEAQDNKVIDTEEAAMMAGVLTIYEQRVRDVMLPKSKMVIVPDDSSFDDTVQLVLESGHSRFPVERNEEIIGILLAKDLLGFLHKSTEQFSIVDIMRPARYIPESKPLDSLLRDFRHQRLHMVIVTNEYGDVSGLVTIEDVLEEIVGEIGDEHDNEEDSDIKKLDNGHFLVSALTEVEDFNEYFGTNLDEEASDTIGGFVLSHFGYVPEKGESVTFAELHFEVRDADDRRILDLTVSR